MDYNKQNQWMQVPKATETTQKFKTAYNRGKFYNSTIKFLTYELVIYIL